jgi:hypothetical protein
VHATHIFSTQSETKAAAQLRALLAVEQEIAGQFDSKESPAPDYPAQSSYLHYSNSLTLAEPVNIEVDNYSNWNITSYNGDYNHHHSALLLQNS